ncbi:lipid-binding SYLF domain-containing protein [Paraburkholderia lycopersici]|uniref:Las17-binding protein actin regulator n=1 Tax=Paraburkholderia lycopersici TaxID=416944 RepID=A0A1G7D5L2_9BURK|nr:YSC84-related protein [Paraburkholderia lycopersici]SDE46797.1 Las17-binding protein actin regulator [Paraburkholderia lycopersici]
MFNKRLLSALALAAATTITPTAFAQQDTAPETTASLLKQTDADANTALDSLYARAPETRELIAGAKGVLIIPDVRAGGAILGTEYGHGVLRVPGMPDTYYNARTASIGAQFGFESKSEILVFLTQNALDRFRNSKGWTVGVDGSVAILKHGKGGRFDTNTGRHAIVGFVETKQGLMFDLSLAGTHFTKAPV